MEQLVFGTVKIEMENVKGKYDVTLSDYAGNILEFDDMSYAASELLNRTVRNLNALASEHDLATILAFEREGMDVIPDVVKESKKSPPHPNYDKTGGPELLCDHCMEKELAVEDEDTGTEITNVIDDD